MSLQKMMNKLRKDNQLTQIQMADYAKISRTHYTNIENGVRRPSPEIAKRIGEKLGFDWTRFFTEEKDAG